MSDLADPVVASPSDGGPTLLPPPVLAPPVAAAVASPPPPPPLADVAGAVVPPPPSLAAPTVPAPAVAPAVPPAPRATMLPPDTPEYRPPTVPSAPAAAPPRPTPVGAAATASALPDYSALTTAARQPKKRGRRFVKASMVLLLLGGLGAAGYVYGPDLYEQYRGGDEPAGGTTEGTAAPLNFPNPTAPPIDVRTATFVLDEVEPDGMSRRYEITTDFQTGVSRVVIDRDELPTLEVMTFLDSAVVRRTDQDVWYQTARGRFPLDDRLERSRWVRHLDELIPAVNRPAAAIEASTTEDLGGEPMRHLVLTIDPALLAGPTLTTDPATADIITGDVNGEAGGDVNGDVSGAAPDAPATAADAPAAATAPVVDAAAPVSPAPTTGILLELWIDDRGLIRRLVPPAALGGETVTVTSISPDEWIPDFPTEEQIEPLTASALVDLGL